MRLRNSIKNIYISLLTQLVMVFLGFLSRKIFLDSLGTEYLGVNGLLTNILSMLALVESGIGASITYNLYKPLSENDITKITALIQLYRKAYGILAIIILIISLGIYIFIGKFIKSQTDIPFIGLVYSLFVFKNIISYLNAHKWSLINADQKGYIIAKYNLIFNVITTIGKIMILTFTKSYILFLVIELIIFIIQNIYNGKVVNDKYSYIKTKEKYNVDDYTKNDLIIKIKAIFMHKIGTYCVFGTDNLLISIFINIKTVGLYSNYTMIIGQLNSLLYTALSGVDASVGNLIATEKEDKIYEVFKVINFIGFWIYSIAVIFLYNLTEVFINWWLGEGLLLGKFILIVVLINFYLSGMRTPIDIFKAKAGIFSEDKYMPLVESIINLSTSIILVKYFGLAGIFLGTTISTISIPLWIQSKLVYNKVFEKSVLVYINRYMVNIVVMIFAGVCTTYVSKLLVINNTFILMLVKGGVCILLPSFIYIFIFHKTDEFKYIFNIITNIILSFKNSKKINILER